VTRRLVIAAALLGALTAPAAASAHAQLEGTTPELGARLERAPREVVFRFDETVEGAFGAVRVYDARGHRVDDGRITRPGGRKAQIAVGVRPGTSSGGYTATFRVISADGHPVSGGVVFQVGTGGPAPRAVGQLLAGSGAGTVTEVAAGAVRAVAYGALAAGLGGLLFLVLVWAPALAGAAGADERWRAAAEGLARRWRRVWAVALATGVLTAALGLVLQAATAGGTSFWSALDPSVVREVLDTRAGRGWLARLVAWLALGAAVAVVARRRGEAPALRRVALGADGVVVDRPSRGALAAVGTFALLLAATPALAGHASVQPPVALLLPLDVVHVLSMSAWLGGLAALLVLLPVATGALEPADRTRLLAGAVARFSRVALYAVIALTASGVVQTIVHVDRWGALLDTAFGRAVSIKVVLLLAVVALGAVNQRRVVPRLRALAAGGQTPGGAGRLLRSTVRAEVALLVVVLGVTGALVSYPPPSSLAAGGPVSRDTRIGPYDLQLTVAPATAGANAVHLYLLRPRDGSPFDGTRELTVTATLPAKGVGPVPITVHKAGPGHYVSDTAPLAPAGAWRLTVTDRVSDFDQYEAKLEVPVR
jgi:copper transport protein